MISYQQINIFKRFYYGVLARRNIFLNKIRFHKMRNLTQLFDQKVSNNYDKQISYRMNWFNFKHQKVLGEWDCVTDQINGGDSKADLYFNKENQFICLKGFVQTKDKNRMIYYPFINMMRTFPSWASIGPMRLLQLQVQTDGKPVQVHMDMKSIIKGRVNIYGFILSKSTQWQTFQVLISLKITKIPIQNMILRGTQQDYQQGINIQLQIISGSTQAVRNENYFSKRNESSIFDKQFATLKKTIRTQLVNQNSLQIENIGIRLVNTGKSQQREIKVRNINLCYKKGYEKFVSNYQSPYFYVTKDQVIPSKMAKPIQYLNEDLQKMDVIDTGDLKYYKKKNK